MVPKIGYSILNLRQFSKKKFPFETYELRASSIKPNIKRIMELKEMFKGIDLSLHSGLSRIFSCREKGYPEFGDSEMDILKYEILISKIIGIKRINFHMSNHELIKKDVEKFRKIIKLANQEGIELIYENHVCSANAILRILEKFPELNICLDLGHLNLSLSKNIFKMDLEEFIEKVKHKIIHIHAHNNDGKEDSHKGINNGIFKWKEILLKLPNIKKIIIEVRDYNEAIESKKILEKFYINLPKN